MPDEGIKERLSRIEEEIRTLKEKVLLTTSSEEFKKQVEEVACILDEMKQALLGTMKGDIGLIQEHRSMKVSLAEVVEKVKGLEKDRFILAGVILAISVVAPILWKLFEQKFLK